LKIAFASGKGGTGKTTLATNLAASVADLNELTAYVDCDVEEPNGHIFLPPRLLEEIDVEVNIPAIDRDKCNLCGVCSDVCEFNAIAIFGPEPIVFPSLCHSCGACVQLCPEGAITEIPRQIGVIEKGCSRKLEFYEGRLNIGEAMAPPVTKALKKMLPRDRVIIIDAPPGTSCPVIEAIKDSDYVVLVTEPTPFGLNDLELAFRMLQKLKIPCGVIINRADIGDNRVEEFCADNNIEILLKIPFDRQLARSYSKGELAIDNDNILREKLLELYRKIMSRTNYG
jgi:MinD superfamily P-loop ATPase